MLTHCNAGWLAAVDWGTALAPVYKAHRAGVPVHVWVDETRPRNQGASLTAYELLGEGVPHTVVVDNVGGHLMQHGKVDLCIVGTDRTTRTGDVCNKVGTYLKALAAHDNGVPFYVALPSSTVDWRISDGVREIPIEERSPDEVMFMSGETASGESRPCGSRRAAARCRTTRSTSRRRGSSRADHRARDLRGVGSRADVAVPGRGTGGLSQIELQARCGRQVAQESAGG